MKNKRQKSNEVKKAVLKNVKAVFSCSKKVPFKLHIEKSVDEILDDLKDEMTQEKLTEESMQKSFEAVSTQRTKSKKRLSLIFLLLNLLVLAGIFLFQFLNEEAVSISDLVTSKINWGWVLISLGLFFMVNILDGFRVSAVVKKLTGKFRPILSLKSNISARFYDNITPLATGGQPFQIYYLNKNGLNASTATSVPLAKYVYTQLIYIILSALILIIDGSPILAGLNVSPVILTMCYIGLGLNLLFVLFVLSLSINKKFAPKIVYGILRFLKFIHIIKDEKAVFEKVMKVTQEYITTFRMYIRSWWLILMEFVSTIALLFCNYSLAFSVYCIFCDFDITLWFTFFVIQLACDLAISFIPFPGGAGTAELSFSALCTPIYVAALGSSAGGLFVWAILFYRLLTYYGYLIQGGLLLVYDYFIGNKRMELKAQRYRDEQSRFADAKRLEEAVNYKNEIVEQPKKKRKEKINKNGDTLNEK